MSMVDFWNKSFMVWLFHSPTHFVKGNRMLPLVTWSRLLEMECVMLTLNQQFWNPWRSQFKWSATSVSQRRPFPMWMYSCSWIMSRYSRVWIRKYCIYPPRNEFPLQPFFSIDIAQSRKGDFFIVMFSRRIVSLENLNSFNLPLHVIIT